MCTVIVESWRSNSRARLWQCQGHGFDSQGMPELIKCVSTFNTMLVALDKSVSQMGSRGFYAFYMSITNKASLVWTIMRLPCLFYACLIGVKWTRTTAKIWVLHLRLLNTDKWVKECRCTVRSRVDLCQKSINQINFFCD